MFHKTAFLTACFMAMCCLAASRPRAAAAGARSSTSATTAARTRRAARRRRPPRRRAARWLLLRAPCPTARCPTARRGLRRLPVRRTTPPAAPAPSARASASTDVGPEQLRRLRERVRASQVCSLGLCPSAARGAHAVRPGLRNLTDDNLNCGTCGHACAPRSSASAAPARRGPSTTTSCSSRRARRRVACRSPVPIGRRSSTCAPWRTRTGCARRSSPGRESR